MSVEISEGLLYFLKYPLLLLIYVFVAQVVRAMVASLPTREELAAQQVSMVSMADLPAVAAAPTRRAPEPEPEPRRVAWLEVVCGLDVPEGRIPLEGPTLFGRAADCTVRLPDAFVSGHHARLTPGSGGAVLEDLGSRNGTWLGQDRIEGSVRLQEGDLFAVGDVTFRYHGP